MLSHQIKTKQKTMLSRLKQRFTMKNIAVTLLSAVIVFVLVKKFMPKADEAVAKIADKLPGKQAA